MTVPAPVADKLAKLIPRLASSHDGEVIATVLAIRRTLTAEGLDLHDLASGLAHVQAPKTGWQEPGTPEQQAATCLAFAACLTDWEVEFCRSVAGRRRFTRKQRDVLNRLVDKARLFARARGGA